jgi:glycosyltransferase involved in cell wall biosynthesis
MINLVHCEPGRRLRVLHVVRNLNIGGLEVGVVNLVNGLHRLGVRQAVCCLEHRGPLAERLPDAVPAWACADGGRTLWRRPELRAARVIRDFRPHVVHARNGAAWTDAALGWVLAGRPGRLVCSIHGFDQMSRLPWKWALVYRQLARLTESLAAVSGETARQFSRETGIPVSRFTVLSSGVDTNRFHPAESWPRAHRPGEPLVLGCVARMGSVKGHEILIRAFAQAVQDMGVNAVLRLIGDGPLRSSLEVLAGECGVTDRVQFLGARDDVPEQLRKLDVFTLASQREGRPTSIMEAMASGLPVVASDVGSVRELVDDGVSGLVVEPGNVRALAVAIRRVATDPLLRQRLGRASRARAEDALSLESMVRAYLNFYDPSRGALLSAAN